jgi:uncharacterized protein
MRFLFLPFIFALIVFQFKAQNNTDSQKNTIDITGTAEKEVIPDEIYVSITIRERMEGKERITLEVQEKNFKEMLKKIGIDINLLSLSDANSDYVKIKYKQKDVLSQISYSLKLNSAKSVGDLFTGLYEIKIYDASIYKVSHSKIEEYKKELRIQAIKNAKEKAEYLTNAIGYQIGKPIIIYENAPIYYDNFNLRGARSSMETMPYIDGIQSAKMQSEPEIEFKKIKLEASIFVKFEVK